MGNRHESVCNICGYKLSETAKAVVSPWIRSFGVRSKRTSRYMTCHSCHSGFFDFRYSKNDMAKIYRNYREENYVTARSKWEPWYNEKFNGEHDSQDFVDMRKDSLYKFLHKLLPTAPKTVVDVGGDRGQYIPNFGQIKNYVMESSSKKLIDDVLRISSFDEISKSNLILYSHVLEHVVDPKAEIENLLLHGDQLYIEVPFGIPEISKTRKSNIRFILKLLASFSPTFWRKSTMPATGRSLGQGVLVQSEHINFFTENSLRKLADILGLDAHIEVNSINTPDRAEAQVIQCLFSARK